MILPFHPYLELAITSCSSLICLFLTAVASCSSLICLSLTPIASKSSLICLSLIAITSCSSLICHSRTAITSCSSLICFSLSAKTSCSSLTCLSLSAVQFCASLFVNAIPCMLTCWSKPREGTENVVKGMTIPLITLNTFMIPSNLHSKGVVSPTCWMTDCLHQFHPCWLSKSLYVVCSPQPKN